MEQDTHTHTSFARMRENKPPLSPEPSSSDDEIVTGMPMCCEIDSLWTGTVTKRDVRRFVLNMDDGYVEEVEWKITNLTRVEPLRRALYKWKEYQLRVRDKWPSSRKTPEYLARQLLLQQSGEASVLMRRFTHAQYERLVARVAERNIYAHYRNEEEALYYFERKPPITEELLWVRAPSHCNCHLTTTRKWRKPSPPCLWVTGWGTH